MSTKVVHPAVVSRPSLLRSSNPSINAHDDVRGAFRGPTADVRSKFPPPPPLQRRGQRGKPIEPRHVGQNFGSKHMTHAGDDYFGGISDPRGTQGMLMHSEQSDQQQTYMEKLQQQSAVFQRELEVQRKIVADLQHQAEFKLRQQAADFRILSDEQHRRSLEMMQNLAVRSNASQVPPVSVQPNLMENVGREPGIWSTVTNVPSVDDRFPDYIQGAPDHLVKSSRDKGRCQPPASHFQTKVCCPENNLVRHSVEDKLRVGSRFNEPGNNQSTEGNRHAPFMRSSPGGNVHARSPRGGGSTGPGDRVCDERTSPHLMEDPSLSGRINPGVRGTTTSKPGPDPGDLDSIILQTLQRLMPNIPGNPSQITVVSTAGNEGQSVRNPNKWSKRHRKPSVTEDTDSDSDSSLTSEGAEISRRVNNVRSLKLPPFTSQNESWEVWINRFNDVAKRRGWSRAEKLDEPLPRLQGPAADFAYAQLSKETRSDFKELCREMEHRFRKIETESTYRIKFGKRGQKHSESAEGFAADLKRIYDKAYPKKDNKNRQEDLLRRFLEGLADQEISQMVAYVKDPKDIDKAAFEVVSLVESRGKSEDKRPRRHARFVQMVDHSSEETSSEAEDHLMVRAAGRPGRKPKIMPDGKIALQDGVVETTRPESSGTDDLATKQMVKESISEVSSHLEKSLEKSIGQSLEKSLIKIMDNKLADWNKSKPPGGPVRKYNKPGQTPSSGGSQNNWNKPTKQNVGWNCCYRCGQGGHYARDCWVISGQWQMSTQSGCGPQAAPYGNNPDSTAMPDSAANPVQQRQRVPAQYPTNNPSPRGWIHPGSQEGSIGTR